MPHQGRERRTTKVFLQNFLCSPGLETPVVRHSELQGNSKGSDEEQVGVSHPMLITGDCEALHGRLFVSSPSRGTSSSLPKRAQGARTTELQGEQSPEEGAGYTSHAASAKREIVASFYCLPSFPVPCFGRLGSLSRSYRNLFLLSFVSPNLSLSPGFSSPDFLEKPQRGRDGYADR